MDHLAASSPVAAQQGEAGARVTCFGVEDATSFVTAWRELAERSAFGNAFLVPDFTLAAAALPGVAAPMFVATLRGDRMTTLLALKRPRLGRWAPMLAGFCHDQAVLGTPLVDGPGGAEDLRLAFAWLRSHFPLAGGVLLRWMPEADEASGWVAAAVAANSLRRLGEHQRAALPGGGSLAELEQRLGAKRRKEFARQRRRLAERGWLQSVAATTPEEVERACTAFAAIEMRGWKGRAGTAFAAAPARLRFLQQATAGLARLGACRIDLLTLDDAPIAAAILLGGPARALYWKTTYDEAFAEFSPGVLLSLDVTARQLADARVALTDSCAVADHPMIDRLWPATVAIADWWLPLRPGGAPVLAGLRAARAGRALAKAAYHHLRR